MAKNKRGLGSLIYMEWVHPLAAAIMSVKRNEWLFETGLPLGISAAAAWLYHSHGKVTPALDAMAELLPSVVPTLIGFTVLFITLILSTDTPAIRRLKEKKRVKKEKTPEGEEKTKWELSEYQIFYSQLTESLFCEIVLLLIVLAYLFCSGLWKIVWLENVILAAEAFLTLHILLGIIRSMTNLYFIFFVDGKTE